MPADLSSVTADCGADRVQLTREASGMLIESTRPTLRFHHSFVRGPLFHRAGQSSQALLRACSNKQRSIDSILDLTAGWGADALTLARHGKTVVMLERNRTLYTIVAHSLACLAASDKGTAVASRLAVVNADALDYLQGPNGGSYDCIYLDPMFPQHKSGAKPAKEMQILQLLTENYRIDDCFELARRLAGKRVVVKRPLKAPALSGDKPDLVKREKTIRFDIYLTG